jgi:hypothetical protein
MEQKKFPNIRKAVKDDLDPIMKLYSAVIIEMKKNGNN